MNELELVRLAVLQAVTAVGLDRIRRGPFFGLGESRSSAQLSEAA